MSAKHPDAHATAKPKAEAICKASGAPGSSSTPEVGIAQSHPTREPGRDPARPMPRQRAIDRQQPAVEAVTPSA